MRLAICRSKRGEPSPVGRGLGEASAVIRVVLRLDPSISCQRFSGLRFASPENDAPSGFLSLPLKA